MGERGISSRIRGGEIMNCTTNRLCQILLVAALGLLVATPVWALEKVGTTSMQVLKIPSGVRGIGMGGALVSEVSGAEAVWWNPGALTETRKNHLLLSQINMPANIQLNTIAFSRQLGNEGAFSLHLINLFTDDMPVRTVDNPEGTGENFNASDFILGGSYGRRLTDRFSLGGNLRYLHSALDDASFDGFSFDLGTLYKTGLRSLKLGMAIQNLGQDVKYSGEFLDFREAGRNEEDPNMQSYEGAALPTMFRLGVSFSMFEMFQWKKTAAENPHEAIIAVEMDHPNDNKERLNLGGEYSFKKTLFLRLGGKFGYDEESIAAGFGLDFRVMGDYRLQFDYAYSHMGRITEAVDEFSGQPHRFSLGFLW
jgi:hypothetical protein